MWCGKRAHGWPPGDGVCVPSVPLLFLWLWAGLFPLLALVSQVQNEGVSLTDISGHSLPALNSNNSVFGSPSLAPVAASLLWLGQAVPCPPSWLLTAASLLPTVPIPGHLCKEGVWVPSGELL